MRTVSYRLPESTVKALANEAARRGLTRSDLLREAIDAMLARRRAGRRPTTLEIVDALVTYPGTGIGDLASRSEHYLRELFDARRRTRRHRTPRRAA